MPRCSKQEMSRALAMMRAVCKLMPSEAALVMQCLGQLNKPVAEELPCGTFVAILPKAPEGCFQSPGPAGAKIQAVELVERGLGAQVGKVTQPKVFDAFERLPARTCQLPMLGFTHRVDRLVEISAEVELVMHDVRLRQEVLHGVAVGAPESIATALTPARCAVSSSCRSTHTCSSLRAFTRSHT